MDVDQLVIDPVDEEDMDIEVESGGDVDVDFDEVVSRSDVDSVDFD